MSLPRYPKYKDSGLAWVDLVPSHWLITKTKYVCQFSTGWTPPTGDSSAYEGNNLWATISDLGSKTVYETGKQISDLAARQAGIERIPAGSLMFSFKLSIGQVSFAGKAMYTNEAIATFRQSDRLSLAFAYFAFPLFLVQNAAENIYGAKLLNQELIRGATFALPPLEEQSAIATFLDRETAKIDALIAEQEKLIALLAEKRQATISHAVTKGLSLTSPMKASGVTWMDEVPAHWHIAKLGLYATVENGTTPSRAAAEYWEGGDIPWLASGEVNQLKITEAAEFITAAALENCSLRLLPVGTVVVGMIGQGKTRGMSAMLCIQATINQNLAAICPGSRIEGLYILYLLHAVYEWLREAGRGGNQAAMNCEILAALRIPVPPLTEQRTIVDFIEAETTKLDSLKVEAKCAIALLKERRNALIAAAVTGKIDVRNTMRQPAVEIPEAIPA